MSAANLDPTAWDGERRLLAMARLALLCFPASPSSYSDAPVWAAAVLEPFLQFHNLGSGNADLRLADSRQRDLIARIDSAEGNWERALSAIYRSLAARKDADSFVTEAIREAEAVFEPTGQSHLVGYVLEIAGAGESPMLRDAYENLQNVWSHIDRNWTSRVPPWWDRFAKAMFEGAPFDLSLVEDPSGPWVEAVEPDEGNVAQTVVSGGDSSRRPSLRMLDDAPIEEDPDDTLGFRAYADALSGILTHPDTRMPFVMAINAPWGAGKSSLARMIERRLLAPDPVTRRPRNIVCSYNAWMNDDAKSLAGSFTASVARAAAAARPWYWQILRPIPTSLMSKESRRWYRIRLLAYAMLVFGALFVAATTSSLPLLTPLIEYIERSWQVPELASIIGAGTGLGGLIGAIVGALAWIKKLADVGQSVANFAVDPQKAADDGLISDARDQLTLLIRQATTGGKRFVVFVDDIERCQPPRAIEVLDVVNQLLCNANVAVVLLGDMGSVAACAGIKYGGLAEEYDPAGIVAGPAAKQAFGRLYLQKIIQMQFDLPPHRPEAIRALMDRLTNPTPPVRSVPKANEAKPIAAVWESGELPVFVGATLIVFLTWLAGTGLRSIAERFGNAALGGVLFNLASGLGVAIAVAAGIGLGVERVRRQRRERLTQTVRTAARESAHGSSTASEAAEAALDRVRGAGLDPEEFRQAAHEAVREERMGETAELQAAYAAAISDLPLLPRNAKRLVNMLRVLIYLARERGLLGRQITPEHIGRWCALRERFPDLAIRTLRSPSMLDKLEAALENAETFGAQLAYLDKSIHGDIHRFLNGEPKLGPVSVFLVHLDGDREEGSSRAAEANVAEALFRRGHGAGPETPGPAAPPRA